MKGVYLVFLRLEEEKIIEIGALGDISFQPGIYVYTGSAMNSVEKRLERHFSEAENIHWHIDYLSRVADVFDYFILPEDSSFECKMAEILSEFSTPVKDFGCSDCNCESHLFRVQENL